MCDEEQRQTFKGFVERELPDTTVLIPQVNELVILTKPRLAPDLNLTKPY